MVKQTARKQRDEFNVVFYYMRFLGKQKNLKKVWTLVNDKCQY